MRRFLVTVAWLATALGLSPGTAVAQTTAAGAPAVDWGFDVTASSAYMWRGMTDIGEASLQPSLWVTFGPVSVTSWVSGPDPDSGMRLREHDLTLEYVRELGSLEVVAGWAHYFLRYAESDRHSQEFFVRLSREGLVRPSIEVARDVALGSGTTVVASAASTVPLMTRLRAGTLVEIGYNHHQWIDGSLFTHVEARASVEWDASARLVVKPYAGWTKSLNQTVLPSRLHGGIELSISSGRP